MTFTLALCASARAQDDDAPWEMAKSTDFAIAVPKDWTSLDKFSPQVLLYRQSEGKGGVPEKDENGQPLQAQIIIEKIKMKPGLQDSAAVVVDRIVNEAGTEVVNAAEGETAKLADGVDAFWLTTEVSRGDKRMLFIKLLCKTDESHGYVVTGIISAGKASSIPSIKGAQGKWLLEMVKSFVIDPNKFDGSKVAAAYKQRDKSS
jgi:hypothetical protein